MNNLEKAIIKEKKFEFRLGMFFLLPAIISTLSYLLCIIIGPFISRYDDDIFTNFAMLDSLHGGIWRGENSPALIFCCLMAMVGVYLIKDRLRYIISEKENNSESK